MKMKRVWLIPLGLIIAAGSVGCSRANARKPTEPQAGARAIAGGEIRETIPKKAALVAGDDDASLSGAWSLIGQMWLAPCARDASASTCFTVAQPTACPNPTASDVSLRGAITTDKTIALVGDPDVSYRVVLHVQGEVEAGEYTGGIDADGSQTPTSRLNGWRVGGTPAGTSSVYLLRVTEARSGAHSDYFLNSLAPPGAANSGTYRVDYMASFTATGGATLRLVATDPDCTIAKNCGPGPQRDGCAAPIVTSGVDVAARRRNPAFDFDSAFNGQWIALSVTNVSLP
jgi:hypothetical protein